MRISYLRAFSFVAGTPTPKLTGASVREDLSTRNGSTQDTVSNMEVASAQHDAAQSYDAMQHDNMQRNMTAHDPPTRTLSSFFFFFAVATCPLAAAISAAETDVAAVRDRVGA